MRGWEDEGLALGAAARVASEGWETFYFGQRWEWKKSQLKSIRPVCEKRCSLVFPASIENRPSYCPFFLVFSFFPFFPFYLFMFWLVWSHFVLVFWFLLGGLGRRIELSFLTFLQGSWSAESRGVRKTSRRERLILTLKADISETEISTTFFNV